MVHADQLPSSGGPKRYDLDSILKSIEKVNNILTSQFPGIAIAPFAECTTNHMDSHVSISHYFGSREHSLIGCSIARMRGLRSKMALARFCGRLIASSVEKEVSSLPTIYHEMRGCFPVSIANKRSVEYLDRGTVGGIRSISTHMSVRLEKESEKEPLEEAATVNPLDGMSTEEMHNHIQEIMKNMQEKEKSIEDLKDKLMRTLADMENLRERTSKQLEEARKFATQGLVKSLVEVADNLERAASSVLKDVDEAEIDVEKAMGLLRSLKDGVVMTDGILMKILEKEGVQRYDPTGQKFDPNLHEALFEVPDQEKEPGTVAVVIKKGYLMHDRAVRAAEVGVVKDT